MSQSKINGEQLAAMYFAGSKWLKVHMAHVNALNVFPVPDGDTGTNMFLTLQSAVKNLQSNNKLPAGEVAARASQGALMGARGNSGVILSQILDGVAQGIAGKIDFTVPEFSRALDLAVDRAYQAVAEPVEGTILTVVKEGARAGRTLAAADPSPEVFLSGVLDAAKETLSHTPDLLPVLKEAGVVDSGGQGLVYFLEGMLRELKGLPIEDVTLDMESAIVEPHSATPVESTSGDWGYDVQFLIHGDNLDIEAIRDDIVAMGEYPLVVGNEKTIKVHVHVPDPGVPISYGISRGYLTDVVVENMDVQSQEFFGEKESMIVAQPDTDIAIICVAPGDGFAKVFESLGAHAVISGGQTMNPSTQEFLTAVHHLNAQKYIILPNNSNIVLTAQQASSMTDDEIHVLPSKTVPQGIGAMLAFDDAAGIDANLAQMHNALEHIHTVEITNAVRNTTVDTVTVKEGDVIGLLDGKLVAAGSDDTDVVLQTLSRIDADELDVITIYYGQSITADAAAALSDTLAETYPHIEVETVAGGQPHYQFIISLE